MTYPLKYRLLGAVLLLRTLLLAQTGSPTPRIAVAVNEAWSFTKEHYQPAGAGNKELHWQPVQLPHTWNATDVMDDEPGYYRGPGWYRKTLSVNASWKTKKVFLFFEGANQVTEVYINGKKAGQHIGGYTGFYIPISAWLQFDGKDNLNEIAVKVDNSYNENIPPLSADFTFYGGIYRDVYLVATEDVHFATGNNGSNGLFITTPQVSAATAAVQLNGSLVNETATDRKLKLTTVIRDHTGKAVGEVNSALTAKAGMETSFKQDIKAVANPRLWSPEDPYLYTAITTIADARTGQVLDLLTNSVGFRWYAFDGEKGFFLNGQPYKLVGANRHEDYQGLGNAVPDELAWKDMVLLKQMGGNFLRIAHYPQDPTILKACDELGILASVEIPIVNEITESDTFFLNCANMQREMIRQNFNHPAIIIWCYMNEVLLRPHFNNDKPRQESYFAKIQKLAKMLDSLTRKEDPSRYTMLVNHGDFNRYKAVGLTQIPMLVGWNLYQGWYGGSMSEFPVFLDRHHKEFPGKPLLVTEYGADADPRIRSFQPIRFDKSVEYTTQLHQYYLVEMLKRPFVAGVALWNLADFNSETREETMPHINNKGLLLWDRRAKDPYYYYKAILDKQPFVKIADAYWTLRGGEADSNTASCMQPVQVSSNLPEAELLLNGISFGTKKMDNGMAIWHVPFTNGKNRIAVKGTAGGKVYDDHVTIDFRLQPRRFADERVPFTQLNVLLGAQRYYIDEQGQQMWLPDQPYQSGSWGYIGGKPFKISRLPYGTDKNIVGTDDDPIYQTQQTGIGQYRLDVPAGEYEVTLHFAELMGGTVKGLPYNLSNSGRKENDVQRSFNVLVNGVLVLEHFNLAEQYGVAKAISKKIKVQVTDNNGINISFQAIEGEPVLNALQVKRLW